MELKTIDLKLLAELLKDSHRSDRQLAKALGVSQPTVTRRRAILEEQYLHGYTAIPKLDKINFEILAFTFFSTATFTNTEPQKFFADRKGVMMVMAGRGLNSNAVCVSVHKTYQGYHKFMREVDSSGQKTVSFVVNLQDVNTIKTFGFGNLELP